MSKAGISRKRAVAAGSNKYFSSEIKDMIFGERVSGQFIDDHQTPSMKLFEPPTPEAAALPDRQPLYTPEHVIEEEEEEKDRSHQHHFKEFLQNDVL